MSPALAELVRIWRGLWTQIEQIAPYWAIGLVAGSLINVYLSEKIVARVAVFKSHRFSPLALCISAALGIASPLCMYGTVPLIASLGRKQVPDYLLAAFMLCSILLNPNLLIMSLALGPGLAMLRLATCFMGGILAGILVFCFFKKKPLYRFDAFAPRDKPKRGFWRDLLRAVQVTAPYLLAGILLTALYDLYFPKNLMNAVFAGNQALGTLFAMSLSVPLYACGGGAIPLLLAWLREGMSAGSAIAFMLAGPATKFTNLGAVKIILGTRNFVLYLLYCLGFALLSGLLCDGLAGLLG